MIRKLAFALSLLGASYSGSVYSLGLGEVSVKSNLNQPLQAEIELLSADEFSAAEVLPGLATREEFLKANVDRVYFLSDIKFKVERNSRGDLVVILSTNKPVREPFLNFLVEVIWPSGRLLREYALLIDPPVFTEEKFEAVQPAQVNETVTSGDVVRLPPAEPERRTVTQVSGNTLGASYGPTKSTDTLWEIALKARPSRNVSPQQVMLAIVDLNPGAFIDSNINKLKAGQVLRLPTIDQIQQRSQFQAIEEVIAQNEEARGKRSKSIASASSADKAPVDSSSGSTAVSGGDELKLVVANKASTNVESANSGDSSVGSGSKAGSDDAQLAITLEKLDKAQIENSELNGRVDDLEEQLETLQRLLTLKNDQLANIQAQMRVNELEKAKAVEAQKDIETETALNADASQEVASEEQVLSSDMVSETVPASDDSAAATIVDSAGKAGVEVADEAQAKAPVAQSSSAEIADEKAAVTKTSDNIVETILHNPLYLGIAIISIIGLVVLLWLVSRNNAKREEEFQASLPDEELDSDVDFEDEYDDVDAAENDSSEELALSAELEGDEDFDSAIEEDEAAESGAEDEDVLAEADVYIAYGRLDQAAMVLENAISKDPVRTDLRLKLLSVYKDSNDSEAFNRQYSELEAIQDEAALQQANAIKAEMLEEDLVSLDDIEHSLEMDREQQEAEKAQQYEESAIEAEAEAMDADTQTFDFDSVELDEDDGGLGISDDDLGIDADDLNIDAELDDVALDESPELGADTLSLDEELSADLGAELEDSDSDIVDEALAQDDVVDGIDDIAEELSAELSEEPALDDFDDSILDVDLGDIDMAEELDAETEIQLPDNLTQEALSEAVADSEEAPASNLSQGTEGTEAAGQDLGDEDDFDFLEGTDEASTKLDLARAYIDMGDIDGARDILEEVVAEGNDDQKAEASDLISKLD